MTALVGMGSLSFVAPEGTGYAIYLAGDRIGWRENLETAQRLYHEEFHRHYTLTVAACIRATEFAAVRSHTRPDGSSHLTVFPPDKRAGIIEIGVWREHPGVITILEAIDLWNSPNNPRHRAIMMMPMSEFGLCEDDGAILVLGRL